MPIQPVLLLEEFTAGQFHCFRFIVQDQSVLDDTKWRLLPDVVSDSQKIPAIIHLIMDLLGERSRRHNGQAIMRDVLAELRVGKEESSGWVALTDSSCKGRVHLVDCGYVDVINFYEPRSFNT